MQDPSYIDPGQLAAIEAYERRQRELALLEQQRAAEAAAAR
jgi:hypothetical protein